MLANVMTLCMAMLDAGTYRGMFRPETAACQCQSFVVIVSVSVSVIVEVQVCAGEQVQVASAPASASMGLNCLGLRAPRTARSSRTAAWVTRVGPAR